METFTAAMIDKFMEPILQEFVERGIKTYLRGDSGFSTPKHYDTCECDGCFYAIRLNQKQSMVVSDSDKVLDKTVKEEQISYAVYMVNLCIRLVLGIIQGMLRCRIEKPYGQMLHMYTFIATNKDMELIRLFSFIVAMVGWKTLFKEGKSVNWFRWL